MFARIRQSAILKRPAAKPTAASRITAHARPYSSESDRKPKSGGTAADPGPDRQISTSAKGDKTVDPKSIGITGRGRRASHHRSAQSGPSRQHYGLLPRLPFKLLSFDHLAHLRPATVFLDLFFSLQRPLLEIELGPAERRSITFESRLEAEAAPEPSSAFPEDVQEDLPYPHITSGSPSDPAFKPPHPSSARLAPDDNELDDHFWSTSDPYSAYLIAEPDGVHPAWSDALKRCLASSQAFVPPPAPSKQDADVPAQGLPTVNDDTRSTEQQSLRTSQSETEAQMDRGRQQALKFLNPYGSTTDKTQPNDKCSSPEALSTSSPGDSNEPLPQDQLSLTMQAARFLHSGMTSNQWPTAANWAAIDSRLKAAADSYRDAQSRSSDKVHEFTDSFPPIRGDGRAINSGRRNRPGSSRQRLTIHGETAGGQTFSFNTEQLTEIIKYSQKIIKDKLGIEAIPKPILKNLERFGEFLIHKHFKTSATPKHAKAPPRLSAQAGAASPMSIVIIDPASAPGIAEQSSTNSGEFVIDLDSVFRKKKRKMKVHKYKKRRKARNVLKKRQGK